MEINNFFSVNYFLVNVWYNLDNSTAVSYYGSLLHTRVKLSGKLCGECVYNSVSCRANSQVTKKEIISAVKYDIQ